MRIVAFLAFLTVSAMVLAGCSGDGDGDGSTSSSSSSSGSATASSTSRSSSSSSTGSASTTSTGSSSNQAPSGSISVAVNGTNATFSLTGSDPDGDAIVWDLTFGDGNATNGTGLPANETHVYAAAGNFTANFTITDGTDSAAFDVDVVVAGSGAGAGPQVVEGSWVTGGPLSCGQYANGVMDPYDNTPPLEGVEWVRFDVAPSTLGKDFVMDVVPAAPAGGPFELQFYDASSAASDYFDSGGPTDFGIAGTVPDNAAFAVFFPCTAGPGDFTYTAG